ncbi:MAG: hypothetical protein JW751_07250, partial [Polyangiaceae bacterium]|nr:hypothetical protein [Polyangiaceae bacterium]
LGVRREFEVWRRAHGGPGIPLPERLWAEAVRAARSDGAAAAARVLRVNRQRLEARLRQTTGDEGRGMGPAVGPVGVAGQGAGFVEIPVSRVGMFTRRVARFEGRDGRRLEIEVGEGRDDRVVQLAALFWRDGAKNPTAPKPASRREGHGRIPAAKYAAQTSEVNCRAQLEAAGALEDPERTGIYTTGVVAKNEGHAIVL